MCRISVQCVPNRGPGRKSIDLNRSLAGRNSIVYGPNPKGATIIIVGDLNSEQTFLRAFARSSVLSKLEPRTTLGTEFVCEVLFILF